MAIYVNMKKGEAAHIMMNTCTTVNFGNAIIFCVIYAVARPIIVYCLQKHKKKQHLLRNTYS